MPLFWENVTPVFEFSKFMKNVGTATAKEKKIYEMRKTLGATSQND